MDIIHSLHYGMHTWTHRAMLTTTNNITRPAVTCKQHLTSVDNKYRRPKHLYIFTITNRLWQVALLQLSTLFIVSSIIVIIIIITVKNKNKNLTQSKLKLHRHVTRHYAANQWVSKWVFMSFEGSQWWHGNDDSRKQIIANVSSNNARAYYWYSYL